MAKGYSEKKYLVDAVGYRTEVRRAIREMHGGIIKVPGIINPEIEAFHIPQLNIVGMYDGKTNIIIGARSAKARQIGCSALEKKSGTTITEI